MKANELRVKLHTIKLKDGYHNIVFDMNVLAEIEEAYGSVQTGVDAFNAKPIKAIIIFVWAFLKQEEKYFDATQKDIGKLLLTNEKALKEYIEIIQKAIEEAMPNAEENEESPNV